MVNYIPNKIMIKAKTEHSNTYWHFGPLDVVLLGMANSGTWLYNTSLDIERLKDSLASTLDNYPVFAGRMAAEDCILTNNAGVEFEVAEQMKYSCKDFEESWFLPENLKTKFDIKAFKKGQFPVMSIKVTQIADGTLINIAVNHVCADGASLYRFVSDWSKNYNNMPVSPVVFNQDLTPKPKHNLRELTKILTQRHWCRVGFIDLFPMMLDHIRTKKVIAPPFFVSYAFLEELRTKYSVDEKVGNHALLCAYLGDMLFNKNIPEKDKYSVASVVDLRGRAVYPEGFIGNAVMNITSDFFDVNDGIGKTAAIINNSLRQGLDKETIEESFQLYVEAMMLKVPFVPFNIKRTYGSQINCLIVNNFTSFDVYNICFGTTSPIKVYPDDLPDSIRIWPGNKQENGVYVFLRGNLVKVYRRFVLKKQ